ncbi:MAG: hypothetical protein AB7T63_00330 [Planctomycetota bacterium]
MYVGSLYQAMSGGNYLSPTFPRGGLAATFAIEVFDLSGSSPTFECTVEHKNEEDTTFSSIGSFTSMTATGVHTLDVSGLKEQIRLSFAVGGGVATNTVYANVTAPMWRPY